jgi:hypothetical protein
VWLPNYSYLFAVVTISEDRLKAELKDLELRLVREFDIALSKRADKQHVADTVKRFEDWVTDIQNEFRRKVRDLEGQILTKAEIQNLVGGEIEDAGKKSVAGRGQIFAIVLFITTLITSAATLVVMITR